jgi:NRAMP (natural resistance-associated macrophage protein)-like metal ion transporter
MPRKTFGGAGRAGAASARDVPPAGTGARQHLVAREPNPIRRGLRILGPGLITGASDDDPSGVGTYAVAGASLGYATLWTTIISLPMMVVTQLISAKIGQVSGRGLAGVLRRHYPPAVVFPAVLGLVIVNTINAGVDIGAIGSALNLLVPIPAEALIVLVTSTILIFEVWGSYRLIATVFKFMTLSFASYIAAAFLAHPGPAAVLRGTLLPTFQFERRFLATLVALFGTTISPYMWFWQASQEVEEKIALGHTQLWQRRGTTETELKYAAWDVNIGMLFSNLIAYFIILATAATLFKAGKTDIQTAAGAAEALRPLAGNAAGVLFALGLVGSGFLAVPILSSSAAYALAEVLGWKHGLDQKPRKAKPFYITLTIATLVGMLLNFVGINPIAALFWTAVLNGFLTPPLLALLMLISNNRKIMGDRVNGPAANVIGWTTTGAMFAAAAALIASSWGTP